MSLLSQVNARILETKRNGAARAAPWIHTLCKGRQVRLAGLIFQKASGNLWARQHRRLHRTAKYLLHCHDVGAHAA